VPRPANPRVRAALLEAGARLIHERGYNGAGVKEIVDAAGVPKGSFYGYFDSKEALLLAVVEHYWEDVQARHGALLDDASRPPRERIAAFFAAMSSDHEARDFALGCLLGSMALETSNSSEPARASLTGLFAQWEERLAAVLAEAGLARELAPVLIEAWEGAAMRGKVAQDRQPYERFERVTLPRLLK
jgi:TetR/AcrR family transcriptional regulator, transcriptional repressor for nem operon